MSKALFQKSDFVLMPQGFDNGFRVPKT